MKKEFSVKLEIDESDLEDLLSTARSDECGCAWWDYKDSDYEEAEASLKAEGNSDPCLETVWARMLMLGKKLRLLDPESDWHWKGHREGELLWKAQIAAEKSYPVGGEWHLVSLKDIAQAVVKYGKSGYANACGPDLHLIIENGDFWDADAVIQIAMYGDVIYG